MWFLPEQMSKEIPTLVGGTKALMHSILYIVLIVSTLGLLNTILMATFERQKEFGYLRCVGAGRKDILKLIFLETLILCTAGGLFWVYCLALSFPLAWISGYVNSCLMFPPENS